MTEPTDLAPLEPAEAPPLAPRTIEQLVQNQTRELELRARELDLQQQEEHHNFEYAQAALAAQMQDRKDERRFRQRLRSNAYLLAGWIILAVVGLVGAALWFNKDQVALEIIKSIVLLLSGGGAGYALGRHQPPKSPSPSES